MKAVHIHDGAGQRVLAQPIFPLVVGGSSQADIKLRTGGPEVLAYVGIANERLFIESASEERTLRVNGAPPITASHRLEDDDVVDFGGREALAFREGDDEWSFHVFTPIARIPPSPRPSSPPNPTPNPTPISGPNPSPNQTPSRPPQPPAPLDVGAPVGVAAGQPAAVESGSGGPREPGAPGVAGAVGMGDARRPSRLSRYLALVGFAALVVAAGFVFTAIPIKVEVVPSPDAVRVRGWLPSMQLGDRRLMLPGTYVVVASKVGYADLNHRFVVASGSDPELRLELEKLPGEVILETTPESGVSIRVDGQALGITPLAPVALRAGPHQFLASAPRYLELAHTMEVQGMGKAQTLALALEPGWAEIGLSTVPPGATVLVDGRERGVTPVELELMHGARALVFELIDHDSVSATVEVEPGAHATLDPYVLKKSQAKVVLSSRPAKATVQVDGKFRGTTPLEMMLSPDESHRLKVSKSGYQENEQVLTLEAGEERSLELALSPQYGVVFLTTVPPQAELRVDGRSAGSATQRLRLTTRAHRLEISSEGFQSKEITVTPSLEHSQRIDLRLEPVRSSAVAAAVGQLPKRIRTADGYELVLVQPAKFRMGASRREQGRRANENIRLVELTRPYYLGTKEVTNMEYRRFNPGHRSGTARGASLELSSQPVVGITWAEAVAYLNWLSEREGLPPAYRKAGASWVATQPPTVGYRLPTEAQWALAARAAGRSTPAKYPWGAGFPPPRVAGNFADADAIGLLPNTVAGYRDGYSVSAPVGKFAANPVGLFDMGGNVAEWVHDYYDVYPGSESAIVRDPRGPDTGLHWVVRGSSWRHAAISELRFSYRDYSAKARDDLGFRIARNPP